jgi:hypothetical protein
MHIRTHHVAAAVLTTVIGVSGLIGTVNLASAHEVVTRQAPRIVKRAPAPYHLNIEILTGKMIHRPGWPKFTPANFTIPAGRVIDVTIRNLDDGTAPLVKGMDQYGRVMGVRGAVFENGKRVTSVNPNDVSHTFTIPGIGVNVPILPKTVTTFEFVAAKKGTFEWQCMATCGTGASGWGGAMAERGYMNGLVRVD